MPRKAPSSIERNIALCYVRQSLTRGPDDSTSPERQRANITAVCARNGWIPEWYIDADGHKSGKAEKNRPAWLALKQRLTDPHVVAVVANDLARLHRRAWHVGRTMEDLEAYGIRLVFAAPGRDIDTSTPHGRMLIQFMAMQDEAYVDDLSTRQKDSIAHRKARGQSVGMPPFGTQRGEGGFLIPTAAGVWLLDDGVYATGTLNEPPTPGAHWFGYYAALERIYSLYIENRMGINRIAYTITEEGWRFPDRKKRPRPFTRDDIRRIVGAWREYAGMPSTGRGRDKNASKLDHPSAELVDTGRAVLPIELLRSVAAVQEARSFTTHDTGVKHHARVYALTGIVYCAHCETEAAAQGNAGLRSRLSGVTQRGNMWYRHVEGRRCGSDSRSVPLDELEGDIARLLSLLTLSEDSLHLMSELARQEAGDISSAEEEAFERERVKNLAKLNRKADANLHLYREGEIIRSDFERKRDEINREISHWQNRTTDSRRIELDLRQCVTALASIASEFSIGSPERKQALVQGLFDHLVYDLTERRIVDFRLKAWADRYLVLRASLYDAESQADPRGLLHTGFEPVFWP